ncbi:MAG: hypothetical protein BWX80_01704 [Candidatus Hydrogenedentes bacterium ADurb.Bin101]|nr:MAG: hypothetical protein BWX80_01704 [Candidatus Hydrogenedentes bacterium ADurb.Bin101]
MNVSVSGLQERGIGIGVGTGGILFEITVRGPAHPLVAGKKHTESVPAVFQIVADECPAAVGKNEYFQTGTWVRNIRVPGNRPSDALIRGGRGLRAFGRIAAVPKKSGQAAVLPPRERRLYRPQSDDGTAWIPGGAAIIGAGHEAHVESVGIEGKQDAPGGQR